MIKIEKVNKYYYKGKANQIHVIDNTTMTLPGKVPTFAAKWHRMPIFERISRWFASLRSDANVVVSPDVIVKPDANFGVNMNNSAAMKLTAFYAGIRIRSENMW